MSSVTIRTIVIRNVASSSSSSVTGPSNFSEIRRNSDVRGRARVRARLLSRRGINYDIARTFSEMCTPGRIRRVKIVRLTVIDLRRAFLFIPSPPKVKISPRRYELYSFGGFTNRNGVLMVRGTGSDRVVHVEVRPSTVSWGRRRVLRIVFAVRGKSVKPFVHSRLADNCPLPSLPNSALISRDTCVLTFIYTHTHTHVRNER